MMMTSGEAVKYSGSLDCFSQVVKKEGVKSLFKGCGCKYIEGHSRSRCPIWLRSSPIDLLR
ncbi:hypothetical protein KP509_15G042100 [Ceratopteris richardii]|uniref:ADP/ATP translocase n=1 Tax=Ceratopteris richardii TaxID=49495 RepID=A0A8T2T4H9_CERRI|nr:hypothetical protein KP509_15G042100 [Ceratopteris richardii]